MSAAAKGLYFCDPEFTRLLLTRSGRKGLTSTDIEKASRKGSFQFKTIKGKPHAGIDSWKL